MEFDNIIYTMLDILHFAYHFKKYIQISFYLRKIVLFWKICTKLTIVRKIPNSGLRSTTSPSVKMNCFLRSFLAVRTMAICCAATDSTGRSIRLNSSKHPHDPDCANPEKYNKIHWLVVVSTLPDGSFTLPNTETDKMCTEPMETCIVHSLGPL